MFKWAAPLSVVFVLSFAFSCNTGKKTGLANEQDTAFDALSLCRAGVIDYEIRTLKDVAVDPKNRARVMAEVHIKYPELQCANNKLQKAVKQHISDFIEGILKDNMNAEDTARAKTIKTASKAFIRSCKSNILELRKEDPDMDEVWYCDIIGNIEMQSGNYFTLRFKYDSYTGGAHGNYGENYATFNIKTGERLHWSQILADSAKFTKLAEARFKQVNGIALSKKLNADEGFLFDNDQFVLSDNFGLTSQGLVVYYEPYQVAPYAFGATTLLFKYFEISDYLNTALFSEAE